TARRPRGRERRRRALFARHRVKALLGQIYPVATPHGVRCTGPDDEQGHTRAGHQGLRARRTLTDHPGRNTHMKSRSYIGLAAALVCGAALAADTAEAQGVKVNGKEIPASRIEAVVKAQLAQGRPDTPDLRNSVKEELINREILAQEAVKKGLDKQADVAAQIDFTRQEILFNAYLRDYLRATPVSDAPLKKEYERLKPQLPAKE